MNTTRRTIQHPGLATRGSEREERFLAESTANTMTIDLETNITSTDMQGTKISIERITVLMEVTIQITYTAADVESTNQNIRRTHMTISREDTITVLTIDQAHLITAEIMIIPATTTTIRVMERRRSKFVATDITKIIAATSIRQNVSSMNMHITRRQIITEGVMPNMSMRRRMTSNETVTARISTRQNILTKILTTMLIFLRIFSIMNRGQMGDEDSCLVARCFLCSACIRFCSTTIGQPL
mmetsp:Transcript_6993/g.10445  ORF Transcript_6993/g.10445 Transcript_6993/m.10445 type:complete len:242 (+) Transcript_6993:461-1186(+)